MGTYGADDFVNALITMETIPAESSLWFCYEYFHDAVAQAFEERKILLLIFADMHDPENIAVLHEFFN